jgi:hypothetical protein
MKIVPHLPHLALFASGLAAPGWALAHDGHGLFGTHWHATDALGFVAVALGLGLAWWFGKK